MCLAAAADHDADFFNPGGDDLLQDDLQGRLLRPVDVDEALQGQTILAGTSGRNDGFSDVHDRVPGPLGRGPGVSGGNILPSLPRFFPVTMRPA